MHKKSPVFIQGQTFMSKDKGVSFLQQRLYFRIDLLLDLTYQSQNLLEELNQIKE